MTLSSRVLPETRRFSEVLWDTIAEKIAPAQRKRSLEIKIEPSKKEKPTTR